MLALAIEFSRSASRGSALERKLSRGIRGPRGLAPSGPISVPGRRPPPEIPRSTPGCPGVLEETPSICAGRIASGLTWSSRRVVSTHRWAGRLTYGDCQVLLRKEVIQPHLPVRLPCYDFTPIANPTFDGSLHKGWATGFGCYRLSWCDGRCVQGPGTYSPQHC